MGTVYLLRGTTFSNAGEKKSYDSEGGYDSDPGRAETMAGAANCGSLPPLGAFGTGRLVVVVPAPEDLGRYLLREARLA